MSRLLATAMLIVAMASVADARWCNSPYCGMCNSMFGSMSPMPVGVALVPIQHGAAPVIESTPQAVVDVMLRQLKLIPGDVLYDLGCGDGRILITAVNRYGCQAVGIEIDPKVAAYAKRRVREAGCGGITIVVGDARRYKLDKATAVTMYLMPPLMVELMPKIRTQRVVTFSHAIPGRRCRQVLIDGWTSVYVLE